MSKRKSKKRKKKNNAPKPKKKNYKSLLAFICVVLGFAAVIAGLCLFNYYTSLESADFADTVWRSKTAYDASADEADMKEVYSNRYDNYQGSLQLNGDGTFAFWMSPGDPDDGTHKGKYSYNRGENTLSAVFDNGDEATFKIVRNNDDTIDHIEAPYGDYTVWFYLQ